jgi:hypothetical protein
MQRIAAAVITAAVSSGLPSGAGLPAADPAAPKARLETVIIVYKTHFDIGYTTLAREVIHEYRTDMVDRVLDAIAANREQPKDRQFVWTLSGWPMEQILWVGQPPERREKIEAALRDGNLAVHAYPFTSTTTTGARISPAGGDGRRMTSRVRLWSFDRYDPESSLYSPAMEARVPLAAARSTARPGPMPPSRAGLVLSRKGVAVTAFGPNPDGPGTVLRVWEGGGASGEIAVTLPEKFRTATPVSLRGEPIGPPIAVAGGALRFGLGAYAPASFVLD